MSSLCAFNNLTLRPVLSEVEGARLPLRLITALTVATPVVSLRGLIALGRLGRLDLHRDHV